MSKRSMSLVPVRRTGTGSPTAPLVRGEVVDSGPLSMVEASEQSMVRDALTAHRAKALMEHTSMLYGGAQALSEMVPTAEPALKRIADQYAYYAINELRRGM